MIAALGLSLVAIGGYCAIRLKKLVAYAHHIGKDVVGIYNECHAGRQLGPEAQSHVRRREAYARATNPDYDQFDASADMAVGLAELNEALEALQRAVSINDGGELSQTGTRSMSEPRILSRARNKYALELCDQGLTVEAIAARCGMTPRSVSKYLSAHGQTPRWENPRVDVLSRCRGKFGAPNAYDNEWIFRDRKTKFQAGDLVDICRNCGKSRWENY